MAPANIKPLPKLFISDDISDKPLEPTFNRLNQLAGCLRPFSYLVPIKFHERYKSP